MYDGEGKGRGKRGAGWLAREEREVKVQCPGKGCKNGLDDTVARDSEM